MNNTPTWVPIVSALTAIVAIVAGAFTTWFTLRSSNKRLKVELEHHRGRLTSELDHQREQDRKKLLFDRRAALYEEVAEQSSVAIRWLFSLESNKFDSSKVEVVAAASKFGLDHANKLRAISIKTVLYATGDTMKLSDILVSDVIAVGAKLNDHQIRLLRGEPSPFVVDDEREKLLNSYTALSRAMRKDLGVNEYRNTSRPRPDVLIQDSAED
jgi:hypothetical protein